MGHSPMPRSPIIPLLFPPKIRLECLVTNSYTSFVTSYSGLLFYANNFHQYSVTLSCIIFLCLCRLQQFFNADFIHSDQPYNYLNLLTVFTVSVDRFTSSLIWQLTQISCDVCMCLQFSFISVFSFVNFFTLNCDNYFLQPVTYLLLNFVSFCYFGSEVGHVTSIFGYNSDG